MTNLVLPSPPKGEGQVVLVRFAIGVAIIFAFVFAHGCHSADEDHEPSTRVEISSQAK